MNNWRAKATGRLFKQGLGRLLNGVLAEWGQPECTTHYYTRAFITVPHLDVFAIVSLNQKVAIHLHDDCGMVVRAWVDLESKL